MADSNSPVMKMDENDIIDQAPRAKPTNDCPPRAGTEPKFQSDKPNMLCGCHKMDSRNLVVCVDGTANQFGDMNTNVIELYNLILKEPHANQRTWYNSGIGTYVRPSWRSLDCYKQWVYHKIDMAIAWDFKKTVLGAYRWLSDNYEPGDCIFLFGFSRGAYQVRVLSAMIEKVGLIYKGNEMQIPFAYELYADPKSGERTEDVTKIGQSAQSTRSPSNQSKPKTSKAERFKSAFSQKDVKVHFVGVWDTVSSIGVAREAHMLPGTVDGMKHVCYFRHALALDERRVKFLPEYAYGGKTLKEEPPAEFEGGTLATEVPATVDSLPSRTKDATLHTKEVWFAGTHSDIGGGNIDNPKMDRSRPPLRWMVFEAGALGLRTARFERELLKGEHIHIMKSLTGVWWLLEFLPIKRLTFTRRDNGPSFTKKPHRGTSRKIHPGQKIHSSILEATYIPKARPPESVASEEFWKKLRSGQADRNYVGQWLESDMYHYTKSVVENLIKTADDDELQRLHKIATTGDGRQAVYDKAVEALENTEGEVAEMLRKKQVKARFVGSVVDIFKKNSSDSSDIKLSVDPIPLVSDLLASSQANYQKTAQDFTVLFGKSE